MSIIGFPLSWVELCSLSIASTRLYTSLFGYLFYSHAHFYTRLHTMFCVYVFHKTGKRKFFNFNNFKDYYLSKFIQNTTYYTFCYIFRKKFIKTKLFYNIKTLNKHKFIVY